MRQVVHNIFNTINHTVSLLEKEKCGKASNSSQNIITMSVVVLLEKVVCHEFVAPYLISGMLN